VPKRGWMGTRLGGLGARHTGSVPDTDVHPELRRIVRIIPRHIVGPRNLPIVRALDRLRLGLRQPGASDDVEVVTLGSGVGVRLFRPTGVAEPAPALLWIHGGGYVLGTAQQDDRLCRQFSARLGITVASVDYRLAPEHPYPVPLQDCYSALTWLAGLPAVDRRRIAIGGASAGGGLAAGLALLARDRGQVTPIFQLLAYPMLDDRGSTTADKPNYRLWDARSNHFGWTAYLGDTDPRTAVPARRDDLSGVAPAWIGVGTNDLVHDEDLAYAERLRSAGVPCDVEVVPGVFHGFDMFVPKAQVSQRFFDTQCHSLRSALTPAG
jgi:acetyl esterase/lipase